MLVLLAGCGSGDAPGQRSDLPPSDNMLEQAARDRGLVAAPAASAVGSFVRSHELGTDALCIAPAGGGLRFSLHAAFGPGLGCAASGTVAARGDGWVMQVDGAPGCAIAAREIDDNWLIAGAVPEGCASVCPGRATLAGLSFPRSGWGEAEARAARIPAPGGGDGPGCGAAPG